MSALGQKQTYAVQQPMSASPPTATAKADIRKRSCPLYPSKRTCAVHQLMSAMGQKRTHAVQNPEPSTRTALSSGGADHGFLGLRDGILGGQAKLDMRNVRHSSAATTQSTIACRGVHLLSTRWYIHAT